MKKVYYKGVAYDYKAVDIGGKRQYSLYEDDHLVHFVEEEELDKKSMVTMILDAYYKTVGTSSAYESSL